MYSPSHRFPDFWDFGYDFFEIPGFSHTLRCRTFSAWAKSAHIAVFYLPMGEEGVKWDTKALRLVGGRRRNWRIWSWSRVLFWFRGHRLRRVFGLLFGRFAGFGVKNADGFEDLDCAYFPATFVSFSVQGCVWGSWIGEESFFCRGGCEALHSRTWDEDSLCPGGTEGFEGECEVID